MTGGTGLYLRALTEGLFTGPPRQVELRARLNRSRERWGREWLHRILRRLDAESAERIHPNDAAKVMRAIEVCLAAKKPMSGLLGRNPLTGYRLLRIGLDPARKELYDRLNARATAMFAAGLVAEAQGLLERYGPVKALDSLGYRQALAIAAGELSEPAGIESAQQAHRNFAKRQLTWFRREPEVRWLHGFGDEAEVLEEARAIVRGALEAGVTD